MRPIRCVPADETDGVASVLKATVPIYIHRQPAQEISSLLLHFFSYLSSSANTSIFPFSGTLSPVSSFLILTFISCFCLSIFYPLYKPPFFSSFFSIYMSSIPFLILLYSSRFHLSVLSYTLFCLQFLGPHFHILFLSRPYPLSQRPFFFLFFLSTSPPSQF